ncbi:hypothetical protein LguiA_018430 [Lonicera macranthoides]
MSSCYLLQDVLIEIFLRLSVKTLLRLKCICKSWSALIENPSFVSWHLNDIIYTKDKDFLAIIYRDGYTKEDVCTLFTDKKPKMSVSLRINLTRQCYILIMGPCNGLFCMYDYFDDLYLSNPATREIKCLPKSSIPCPLQHIYICDKFGFGFDSKTGDYKVIRLLSCSLEEERCEYQIELYTLSTNSWRKINVVVPGFVYEDYDSAMYLNGVYHWWVEPMGLTKYSENVIFSFDMASECFETTPLPQFLGRYGGTFGVYNESLAVIFCYQELFELWTVNGYGSKVCWEKLLSIGPLKGVERPLGIWKNNEYLFVNNSYEDVTQVVSYNSKNEIVRILILDDSYDRYRLSPTWIKIAQYRESLVSISGTN